jgi:predicted nucleic acid-binding protein
LAESASPWAITWPCLYEFLNVVTRARIYQPPTSLAEALVHIDSWLASPSLVLLSETPAFYATLVAVLNRAGVVGPRIGDARIAALCLHHGVTMLYSTDRDFSRFGGLRTANPLVSAH